jgi:predicted amidohydrolase
MSNPSLLKTFVIQFQISLNVRENEDKMLSLLNNIQRESFVVFPEGALSGYSENATFVNAIDRRALDASLA